MRGFVGGNLCGSYWYDPLSMMGDRPMFSGVLGMVASTAVRGEVLCVIRDRDGWCVYYVS